MTVWRVVSFSACRLVGLSACRLVGFSACRFKNDKLTSREADKQADAEADGRGHYMRGTNMMCAFGVPGYMIHGVPCDGIADRPVDWLVAFGM